MRRIILSLVLFSLLCNTVSASVVSYTYDFIGLPQITSTNIPFSYARPSAKKTFLVHDSFVGSKAQLKPISNFFLEQPWTYWSLITLDGCRTRSLATVFAFSFGDTFNEERNRQGAVASIYGLTDSAGNALSPSSGINDVLASSQVKPALLKAVQESFPDISGDEWYAGNVALAVMLGIIGGRPDATGDGLIFAGDELVTRAEWMVMINRISSLADYSTKIADPWLADPSRDGVVPSGAWFLQDYNLITSMGNDMEGLYTLSELSQPISRAEAAFIFAKAHHGLNFKSGFDFYNPMKYRANFPDLATLSINPIMKDLLNDGKPGPVGDLKSFCGDLSVTQALTAAQTGQRDFPYPLYEAAIRLNLAGILAGYSDGLMHPFDNLTRGQALALLFKACEQWPNGFYDSFD